MDWSKYKLIVFGCSFVYGHGLPDCLAADGQSQGPKPSKLAWPSHLFAKQGFKSLDNQGICGASNKQITRAILNYNFNEPCVVVIQWSRFVRKTFFKTPDEDLHMMPHFIKHNRMPQGFWNLFGETKDDYTNKVRMYYDHFYYDYDVYFEQCLLTNFIHNWLEERSIKNFHLFEDTAINEFKKTFNLTKSKTLQAKTFRYNKDFKVDNALDTKNNEPHPGVRSQVHFSDFVKNWLDTCD